YFFGESVASKVPAISAAKKFASAAGPLSGLAGKVPGVGAIFDLTDKAGMLLQMSLGALFAVGALMSLYFPFIPFIAWMGGLVQYVTIFFEGLVAAPIWAFAHLDVEGEGMGQRAERGYIFILNMLFRPFLMILGFVLAAGLLVVLGTLQMVLFMPAMANVQGNSLTGAASILILLGIFCMLNITLIHGLFNMVTLIPDQVLGWVGNMGNTQLGKEVEEKAHQMFVSLGRTMAGGVNASPAKSARDKAGDKAAASLRRGGVGSHDGKKPGA
ncbi:MAG: DotA/TraY family protein, partial [Betaproteobacteria bacterium]